jgi:hypothetical protein
MRLEGLPVIIVASTCCLCRSQTAKRAPTSPRRILPEVIGALLSLRSLPKLSLITVRVRLGIGQILGQFARFQANG